MAKSKPTWGQPRSINAIRSKPYKAGVKREVAEILGENPRSWRSGSITQRELDAAVTTVGGRGSKAVAKARAAAQGARSRTGVFTGDRLQALEGAVGKQLLKGALRGMLSPAGLTEGVAGATVKAMRDAGAPMTPQEMMKKKGMPKGRIVKGTRRGERA